MAATTTTLTLAGLKCQNCIDSVTRALRGVAGVDEPSVRVTLEQATVGGGATAAALIAAVERVGFDASVAAG